MAHGIETVGISAAGRISPWLPLADQVIQICRDMYPVKGLIVSPEIDRAFEILRQHVPQMKLHSYASGTLAEDWEVPLSWQATAGALKDAGGKTIASLEEHFLFVAPYSEPVDGWFTKAEIAQRSRTNPDQPSSFFLEHRNAYNKSLVDWGITLPHERWIAMPDDGKYHVRVETRTMPGHMRVGEWILPGKRPEVICLCSQFDELCNDGQSSGVVAALFMKELAQRPEREFTYQLLLVPEMFGTLFYAYNNQETVGRTVAMLNLETLGAGRQWVLKKALRNGGALEEGLRIALNDLGLPFIEKHFFQALGNDERVYGWPTIDVPGPALQRFPFDEYHSQFDTPDILDRKFLAEALAVIDRAINVVECNYIPKFTTYLPPWLSKHRLYIDVWVDPDNNRKLNNHLLFHIDGKRSLIELARIADVPFFLAHDFLEKFFAKGLIQKLPCDKETLRRTLE
jgi:aminopeptidase-like protein